jgi:hypothetical protein
LRSFGDPLQPGIVFLDGMLQFEQLIFLLISFQRSRHLLLAGPDALIAQPAKFRGSRSPARIARMMVCPDVPLPVLDQLAVLDAKCVE